MTAPLTDALLAEVESRAGAASTYADYHQVAGVDVPALVAEVRALRGELAQIRDTLADNRLAHTLAAVRMIATESATGDADLLRRAILDQLPPFDTAASPELAS